jgi:ketosteroid isomerase-like protein
VATSSVRDWEVVKVKDMTQRFISALSELHSSRNVDPLVQLFADDATLGKVGMPHQEHGKDGARNFWRQYREVFDAIEASYRLIAQGDDAAFLEWTSTGTLADGSDFRYEGVSVLEARGDAIGAFRTYYDTAAFLPEEGKTLGKSVASVLSQ